MRCMDGRERERESERGKIEREGGEDWRGEERGEREGEGRRETGKD